MARAGTSTASSIKAWRPHVAPGLQRPDFASRWVLLVLLVLLTATSASRNQVLAQSSVAGTDDRNAAAADAAAMAGEEDPCLKGVTLFRDRDYLGARPLMLECLQVDGENMRALLPLTVMAVLDDEVEAGVGHGER